MTLLDNFTRPDEVLTDSANWAFMNVGCLAHGDNMWVVSNVCGVLNAFETDELYWTTPTGSNDNECGFTFLAGTWSSESAVNLSLWIRVNNPGTEDLTGYFCEATFTDASTISVKIYRADYCNSFVELTSGTATLVPNDVFTFEVCVNTFTAKINGTPILSVIDSEQPIGQYIGMRIEGVDDLSITDFTGGLAGGPTSATLSNMGGGTFVVAYAPAGLSVSYLWSTKGLISGQGTNTATYDPNVRYVQCRVYNDCGSAMAYYSNLTRSVSRMSTYNPAVSAFSRVFITKGGSQPNHRPEYQGCMKATGVSQDFGDVEPIQCPSDESYGQFVEVGQIKGAVARAQSSLVGLYAADVASALLETARQRCGLDIQVHFGKCTDPRVFNTFTKALVWEGTHLANYSTDDLGAMGSDENAKITETSNISIQNFYEILPLTIQQRATSTVVNQLVDAVICDRRTCGDCDEYNEGCNKAFVLQGGILGSPGTPPDVIWTDDKGKSWSSDTIDSMLSSEAAEAIACLGDYVVVVAGIAASNMHYKEKADILNGTAGGWTEVNTGFVAAGLPADIWSVGVGAYIVGAAGYVYWCDDPTLGVSVLDAGIATTNALNAVHALDDQRAVAVGDSDTIIYTVDRYTWVTATATGGGNNLEAVWMVSESEWWVGDSAGGLYYTLDSGVTWTAKALPGVSISAISDIQFPSKSVGYISGTANSLGALWRSYDGGYSWVKLPEGAGSLPGSANALSAIASCTEDVNHLIAVGATVANDGVLLVGED